MITLNHNTRWQTAYTSLTIRQPDTNSTTSQETILIANLSDRCRTPKTKRNYKTQT